MDCKWHTPAAVKYVCPVCPQFSEFPYYNFSVLPLFVGHQEEHLACKNE